MATTGYSVGDCDANEYEMGRLHGKAEGVADALKALHNVKTRLTDPEHVRTVEVAMAAVFEACMPPKPPR